jgi:hypothetical protein
MQTSKRGGLATVPDIYSNGAREQDRIHTRHLQSGPMNSVGSIYNVVPHEQYRILSAVRPSANRFSLPRGAPI